MTIDQTNVVDFIGIERDTGRVSLTISDHLDWEEDEGEHLLMLQEKLNSYLNFVENGELEESYPHTRGRSVVIKIFAKYPLSQEAEKFFRLAKDFIEKAGFSLEFRVLET